ncbi:MAG: hypothetical protein ABGX16_11590 [Pirellulales bacterium]
MHEPPYLRTACYPHIDLPLVDWVWLIELNIKWDAMLANWQ